MPMDNQHQALNHGQKRWLRFKRRREVRDMEKAAKKAQRDMEKR